MNQVERLDYLLKEFIMDSEYYKDVIVDDSEKRNTLRALMNIRMPKKINEYTLEIQNEFLTQETIEKGIIKLEDLETIEKLGCVGKFVSKVSLFKGDITRLSVDAIVNSANENLLGCFIPCHKCIDNAIHSAAGIQLRDECFRLMQNEKQEKGDAYTEPTGKAKITGAYNLPCKAVIHTVGPIVRNGLNDKLRNELKQSYISSLNCLIESGYRSIAFCCISTGEFHFPNREATEIAISTVFEFLEENGDKIDRVIFDVFKDIDEEIYKEFLVENATMIRINGV